MDARDLTEWETAQRVAALAPQTGMVPVRSSTLLAVDAEITRLRADFAALQHALVGDTGASAILTAQRLRAALAQPAAPGWQPIETAPNGPHGYRLIANAETGHVAAWIDGVIHNRPGTAHDWQYGEAITHWMPLPAAPQAPQPGAQGA